MNINRRKQSQFELFPGTSKVSNSEVAKIARITKDLTLSLENIIVLCIIFVMAVVLFFSFGVEKGKRIAMVSGRVGHAEVVQADDSSLDGDSARLGAKVQQQGQTVLPVVIPDALMEESQPVFRPPLEETDEQKRLFTIQVASFKLRENAQREAEQLKDVGHEDIFVMPKGSYSIVCVGKFEKRIDAKRFSNRLKNRYNDCLVRRL